MGTLIAKYAFIREDVELIGSIDEDTGEQRVLLQHIDLETGDILAAEMINCIHYAVTQPASEGNYGDEEEAENEEEELFTRSSENTDCSEPSIPELFQALTSWVAGIAELGPNAFRTLSEIEEIGDLGIPISGQMFRFMALIDSEIALSYLDKIKKDCVFEGQRHDPSMIASVRPILDALFFIPDDSIPTSTPDIFDTPTAPGFPQIEIILDKIFELDPPLELFTENIDMVRLLQQPQAVNLTDFSKGFAHKKAFVRKAAASNPKATGIGDYKIFLSELTEPDESVRRSAARHANAPSFADYANFFSRQTESSPAIRQLAAENPQSVVHPEFSSFLSFEAEDDLKNLRIALTTLNSFNFPLYRKLSAEMMSPFQEVLAILELQDMITSQESFYKSGHKFLSFEDPDPEEQRVFKYQTEGPHIISVTAINCNLVSVPASITRLRRLRRLNLEGNPIENLPKIKALIPDVQISV